MSWITWLRATCIRMLTTYGGVPSVILLQRSLLVLRTMWSPNILKVLASCANNVPLSVLHEMLWPCTSQENTEEIIDIVTESLDRTIKDRMVFLASGLYGCSECPYTTKYSTTCQNHIESKHMSTNGFICNFCEKFCPTRNALKSHVSKKHNK